MTYPTIEVKRGPIIIKGRLVQNAGKNNGILIRRDTGTHNGRHYDKTELVEVFYTKEAKNKPSFWKVQGPTQKVRFPLDTLRGVIECMNILYGEIYGLPGPGAELPTGLPGDPSERPTRPAPEKPTKNLAGRPSRACT